MSCGVSDEAKGKVRVSTLPINLEPVRATPSLINAGARRPRGTKGT